MKKVYVIENIGIAVAGSSHSNMLIEEVSQIVKEYKIINATYIMQKVREIGIARYDEWFEIFPLMPIPNQNPAFTRPQIELSIVGYDILNIETKPRMYSLSSIYNFAPNLHNYGFMLMGVASYALYLLNRLYSNDMDMSSLKHLAAYVITETATQDGKVGGDIQMAEIKSKDSKLIEKNELSTIIDNNKIKAEGLKSLFKNINSAKK